MKKDLQYIKSVLAGNTDAFSFLVEKYQHMAYTIAFRISHNEQDAEEIAQDAFVKAFNHLHKYKQKSKFTTWFYRIVYTTAISHSRKKQIEKCTIDDTASEKWVQAESNTDNTEYVRFALKKLPDDEQLIITLYYYEELQISDIADIVNLSQSNVKVKLHRIRNKLAGLLEKAPS